MRKDNGALVAIAATAVLAVAGVASARAAEGSRSVVQRTADGSDFVTEEKLSNVYHDEDNDGWAEMNEIIGDLRETFYYVPSESELRAISFIAGLGYEPAETLQKNLTEIRTYGGFGSRPIKAIKIDKAELAKAMLTSGTRIAPMLDHRTMLYKVVDLVYNGADLKYLLYEYASPLIDNVESFVEQELDDRDIERAFGHKEGTPENVIDYLIQRGKIKREMLSRLGKKMIPARRKIL